MNARDLEMLDAWRHGRLSEEEFAVLQERLHADAELRAALRALAEVEEGLSALATARVTYSPLPSLPYPSAMLEKNTGFSTGFMPFGQLNYSSLLHPSLNSRLWRRRWSLIPLSPYIV